MPSFRVTLTPGILNDLSNPILVRFTSPRMAQEVEVRLLEMDSWDNLGDTLSEAGATGHEVVAEFTGEINNFRFVKEGSRLARESDQTITLKVQFHGSDQVIDVPIPNAGFDVEGGEIEIGLSVFGRIGRSERAYSTPLPVFVRHPSVSGEANRPVVTFITTNDAFHRAGRAYWVPRSDGVRSIDNLQQILEFLSDAENLVNDLKWGQINIVAHGNENEWFVQSHRRARGGRALSTERLEELDGDADLATPGEDTIDQNTVLVMRGCSLGNNQRLLDAVRELFGGRLKVLAPKYYQFYEFRGNRNRELFWEGFHYWQPGNRRPTQAQAIAGLRAEYDEAAISDDELQELVADARQRRTTPQNYDFQLTYEGDSRPPSTHAGRMDELRGVWSSEESNDFTEVDDWNWVSNVGRRGGNSVATYRGTRLRVEYRRLMCDDNGNAVVPDLNDSSHYGRSPAW